jgi:hypothetical protein
MPQWILPDLAPLSRMLAVLLGQQNGKSILGGG